jgi:hypothetical protein
MKQEDKDKVEDEAKKRMRMRRNNHLDKWSNSSVSRFIRLLGG